MIFILLIFLVILLLIWLDHNYLAKMKKWSYFVSQSGMTGAEIAKQLLLKYELSGIQIIIADGEFTDNYDPNKKTIGLSQDIYYGNSLVAVAIAAHEVGHAKCDQQNKMIMKVRSRLGPYISFLVAIMPVLLISALIFGGAIFLLFICLVLIIVVFHVLTIYVEIDASKRAFQMLVKQNVIMKEEHYAVKETLTSAAATYVTAMFKW
ncbi:zinc metallopeptidase [Paenibacillus sp. Leaf72]|uniref:zinc metallopeptidase n=1 Tax=Paenibacillus sp. Leaf72 TaxID=1736234 RepID=UPI0006FA7E95|nr:zinc metallopeptidase [Paenibacillus sp. Leaf72]KQN96815.1 hypothetical protein ASF12_22340 [Paenibacillus sp. Leaf72]